MKRGLYIFLVLMAAGCSPAAGDFVLVRGGEPVLYGVSSLHGKALVESHAGKTVLIENATLVFRYKSRELATARLMLPIEIAGEATSDVRYDLKLEQTSLSALQTLLRRMEINPSQVFVDVRARVRYGNIRRTLEIKDVPYSDIIANFAPGNILLQ